MRRVHRPPLTARTHAVLENRTSEIASRRGFLQKKNLAQQQWGSRKGKAWQEVTQKLHEMANGVQRCMYCEDSEGTDTEHFFPKSKYPHWAFDWDNYLLACSSCNSNHKRSQFPLDHKNYPLLIDPSIEDPQDYLEFDPFTGKWVALDNKGIGEASIKVFGLDRQTLVQGRKNAWHSVQSLIIDYDRLCRNQPAVAAQKLLCIHESPFSGVVSALIRFASNARQRSILESRGLLDPKVAPILRQHPKIAARFR